MISPTHSGWKSSFVINIHSMMSLIKSFFYFSLCNSKRQKQQRKHLRELIKILLVLVLEPVLCVQMLNPIIILNNNKVPLFLHLLFINRLIQIPWSTACSPRNPQLRHFHDINSLITFPIDDENQGNTQSRKSYEHLD